MAALSILNEDGTQLHGEIVNDDEAIILGRSEDCDVIIPSKKVSRRHARIVCIDEEWMLEDAGSMNGTFLNGERLNKRTPLWHGDLIEIEDSVMRFEEPIQAGTQAGGDTLSEGDPRASLNDTAHEIKLPELQAVTA